MSEVITDKLTGRATANDVTVTVGATATQSLEKGLAKVWTMDETLASNANIIESTFNVSSTSDEGTGNVHISFTNGFSANDYVAVGTNAGWSANDIISTRHEDATTGKDDIINHDSAVKDATLNYVAYGDLA